MTVVSWRWRWREGVRSLCRHCGWSSPLQPGVKSGLNLEINFKMHNRNLHTTKPRDIGWLNLYVRVLNGPSQPNQKHLWDFRHSPLCLLNCRVTCKALHTQDINKSLLAFSTRLFWFQPDLTSPCLTSVTCCCSCCAQDSRYRWAFRKLFYNFSWWFVS